MLDQHDQIDFTALKAWILSDGKNGHLNQSLGVAEALGVPYEIVPVQHTGWAPYVRWIDPFLGDRTRFPDGMPDLLLGAGNATVALARALKLRFPKIFAVQMMRPAGGAFPFDVVAVPAHDKVRETEQVIITTGAPNRITPQTLAQAAEAWRARLAHTGTRRLGVLIGGASKHAPFTEADARELAAGVFALKKAGGFGLMVTVSRRTGEEQSALLRHMLAGQDVFFWDGQGDNPYQAILALADALVVTGDSVSMVSEGCTAGKPVHVWGMPRYAKGKLSRLYQLLSEQGRIAPLGSALFEAPQQPLADATRVAGFIRSRYWRHHLSGQKI
jgi:mitochondrial fission protein ELM1